MWLIMAALSALFAGLTAILAKCGIKKTDSKELVLIALSGIAPGA